VLHTSKEYMYEDFPYPAISSRLGERKRKAAEYAGYQETLKVARAWVLDKYRESFHW